MAKSKSILGDFKTINSLGFNNQIENIYYKDIKQADKNRTLRNIDELAEDIAEAGLEDNLVVRKIEHGEYKYELIAGHRRFNAILKNISAGDNTYENIPCKVQVLDDIEARKRLILNNFYADPLTEAEKIDVIEELRNIYKLKKENGEKIPGRIQNIIAEDVGLKKSQVGNYEKIINNAIPEVREKIKDGEMTVSAATELCSLEDEEQLMFIEEADDLSLKTVKEYKESLSYNEVEEDCEEMDLTAIEDYDMEEEEAEEDSYEDEIECYKPATISLCVTQIDNYMDLLKEKIKGVEWESEVPYLEEAVEAFGKLKLVLDM